MPVIVEKTRLSELSVKEAMRAQVVSRPAGSSIEGSIRFLIKYKVNSLLILDEDELPAGVVSKTDIMAAYYALLPINSPLADLVITPPVLCDEQDSLESALETMRSQGVHRLYVRSGDSDRVVGVLSYPDIVAMLYQFCRNCERSLHRRRNRSGTDRSVPRFRVKDLMTPSVMSFSTGDCLSSIMEGLSLYHLGAVLIRDSRNVPSGVISKTDLMMAYKRGIAPDVPARAILNSCRILSCEEHDFIEEAIRRLIFSELHRLFVHRSDARNIVGVFSLTDAARLRSGSCHACPTTRIDVEPKP
jgi:predicted transcriptional regulator